ncbi:PfkB family carbohydrate kinase [Thermofilum pendens]|uniref:PfkB domain protein n=1 Tax=Thermofilum pendens (strain DSM 2475 / Hrk 5) TaxID=368408 RepID=A1RXT6_THEPD|nr:PfkB family carbohydrate kinase [Thermofilum pendens]ABL78016.1 PfkB domain protein [Thermofilum pendens Hrk 5]
MWGLKVDVYLIGHLTVDIVVEGGNMRRSLGGTVTFGSLAAIRHNATPHVVSKVGRDFPDEYLMYLGRNNVDLSYVRLSRYLPTTKFKLVYREGGERVLYLLSRCEDILSSDVPLDKLKGNIAVIGALIGEVPPSVVQEISEHASLVVSDLQGYVRRQSEDRSIVLASTPEAKLLISLSDVVHAEVAEAKAVFGDLPPAELAKRIVEGGAAVALVTLGAGGAYVATKQRVLFVPSFPTRVVDRTGAGDVFTTVFAIEYHRLGDYREAAAYATAAVSFLIEKPGPDGLRSRWEVKRRAEKILNEIREYPLDEDRRSR